MQTIEKCRSCDSSIVPFFDLGLQPFANALLKENSSIEDTFSLSLSWCSRCNLVQLNETANPTDLFSNYVWLTSTSTTAIEYAEIFCSAVKKHLEPAVSVNFVLEIASNDGTFLRPFLKNGYNILGVDPAQNIAEKANESGIPTLCGFFDAHLASKITSQHGYPKLVFARNVLPHVANLHGFVEGLRYCLQDNSLLVLEVHSAERIIEDLHYDSIYHEHLCYFSLHSLEFLLNTHGLYIYDVMSSQISGGSIVAFIRNKQLPKSETLLSLQEKEWNTGVNELKQWKQFAEKANAHKYELINLLDIEIQQKRTVVGYGASARSSTMLNYCKINDSQIPIIADQNELKQGLYTPGSHIRIDSPDRVFSVLPDTVVVLAWNFMHEIAKVLKEQYGFEGRLLIPLPYPPKTVMIGKLENE